MKNLRPKVASDDGFLSKIVKYIPAEILAVYTAIIGIWKDDLDPELPDPSSVNTYFITLLIIVVITPIWTYVAVSPKPDDPQLKSEKRRAIFHAIVATISFIVWIYAVGDIMFKSWLCGCTSGTTDCFKTCTNYNTQLGAVILILYTGLIVPLLEKLILPPGKKLLDAREIIEECKKQIKAHKDNCSGFVKAVAKTFKISLNGQADDIAEQIKTESGWTKLTSVEAKQKAGEGWLVIAALKSSEHNPKRSNGHVCIIVDGPLDPTHKKYPTGYWGSSGGSSGEGKTINYSWNEKDRDKVYYYGKNV